ncbi:monocarboxylate transporter 9 [Rhipicephalus sanguineus]|uniref:monocarboxylate transporter 9 n=1 Tax=Rhipicephalus sanguineus TaxID=34632 RepID=UPI0018944AB1|nr:monocarboxylate transporter 9 [Rhipicephalus sanguineus]XP_037514391.1 monocarboxylate transporter 9 [Rhipicephalus sanguineus]
MENGNKGWPGSSDVFTISKFEPESQRRTSSVQSCLPVSGRASLGGYDHRAPKASDIRSAAKADGAGVDKCWWVAVLAFVMTTMESSSSRCSGFLMVGIMEQMNVERGLASWPVSLIGSLIDCGGLLSGPLSELFTTVPVLVGGSVLATAGIIASAFAPDITWLTVTLGAMHGLGLGIVITMLQVLISMYFERYRGAANGIMFAGSTASAFIFPHLLLFFGNTYGFRGSLLLFGAVLMNMVAVSLAFREPPWVRRERIKNRECVEGTQRSSLSAPQADNRTKVPAVEALLRNIRAVLKCAMIYVLVITWLVFCYNYDIFFSTIVDFGMDKGVSLEDAVSFITYTSITDLVGRVMLPILTDRGFMERSTLMTVDYLLLGLCAVSLPFCESYWTLLTACLGVALFLGCAITMQSVLMAQYLGLEKLAVGYTVLGAFCGPALLGKAPFVGFFRDDLGSYNEMFWVLGSFSIFVSMIWVIVYLVDKKRARKWQPDITDMCSGPKT